MSRLVIHIGTHKTGTTSIQRTLGAHRQKLASRNIAYPDYDLIGLNGHYAHFGISNGLAGEHPSFNPDDAVAFFNAVRDKVVPQNGVTILSGESLYRLTLGDKSPQGTETAEDYWAIREAFVEKVRQEAGPAEIVMVVRPQADFAESMYQEHVKVVRYRRDFKTFLKEFWFHFEYLQQYNVWKKHFGKVTVVPFSSIAGPTITEAFLAKAGIDTDCVKTRRMENVSVPHDGVILKRILNRSSLPLDQLKAIGKQMTGQRFRQKVKQANRSFFSSAEQKLYFQSSFNDANAKLASDAGCGVLFDRYQVKPNIVYGDFIPATEEERLSQYLDLPAEMS